MATAAGGDRTGADVRWLSPEEMRAWRAFLGAHARLVRALDTQLVAAHGIALGDHEVLIHLSEAPQGRLRMAELADRLSLSRSGLTRRVDALVRTGYVVRSRCPEDGRGVQAELTAAGRAALEGTTPTHVEGVRRAFVDRLTDDELRVLAGALEKVADTIDLELPACPGPRDPLAT